MNPELSGYISHQLASGISPEDISAALIAAGWQASAVEQAFRELTGQGPQPHQPEGQPAAKKKFPTAAIFALIVILSGGIYATFLATREVSLPETQDNAKGEENAEAQFSAANFTEAGLRFSYDGSWKKVGMGAFGEAISSGDVDSYADAAEPETDYLFFSPNGWQRVRGVIDKARGEVEKLQPDSGDGALGDAAYAIFKLMDSIYSQSELRVSRIYRTKALDAAREATKTTCDGYSFGFSTDNPIIESRIKPVAIAGGSMGHLLLPISNCDAYSLNSITIYFDSASTVLTEEQGAAFAPMGTGGAAETDAFAITFNGASSLENLTPAQRAVFESIRLQ